MSKELFEEEYIKIIGKTIKDCRIEWNRGFKIIFTDDTCINIMTECDGCIFITEEIKGY